jgi:hypothetical protein
MAGGLIGSIAGAALAIWVGGVDLMEGVSVLGPMAALGGGLARLVGLTIRRSG